MKPSPFPLALSPRRFALVCFCLLAALALLTGCAGIRPSIVLEHEKYGTLTYRLADPYGLNGLKK